MGCREHPRRYWHRRTRKTKSYYRRAYLYEAVGADSRLDRRVVVLTPVDNRLLQLGRFGKVGLKNRADDVSHLGANRAGEGGGLLDELDPLLALMDEHEAATWLLVQVADVVLLGDHVQAGLDGVPPVDGDAHVGLARVEDRVELGEGGLHDGEGHLACPVETQQIGASHRVIQCHAV
eukprot:1178393-Prorocentrum_minimum.AAC.5